MEQKTKLDAIPTLADPRAIAKWQEIGPMSVSTLVESIDLNDMAVEPHELEFKKQDRENVQAIGFFKKGTNTLHGLGRIVTKNGFILEGMHQKNQLNGYGRSILADGSFYEGMYKNHKRDGKGK